VRSEAALRLGQYLLVADIQGLNPPLLTQSEADEEAKLDQLRVGKVGVQLLPEGIVGYRGVPYNGAGVGEGGLLALAERI
jgi:hypothetical protein